MKSLTKIMKYRGAGLLISIILLLVVFWQPDIPVGQLKEKYATGSSQFVSLGGMDVHFRDAMALRNAGFLDQSITMLNRICDLAYQAKPGDKDYLRLISAGNRSAQSIGRILIEQKRRDEARAVMHKAWKAMPFDPDMPGLVPLNLFERKSLLTTLLTTIDNVDGNPTATQIMAELESINNRFEDAVNKQVSQTPGPVQ